MYSDVNGIAAVCLNSVPDAVEMALPSYLEVEVNAERTFVLHKVSPSVSTSAHALV